MNYHDGSAAKLGDIVSIPMPDGNAKARLVMLGDTGEHLEMDAAFIEWVESAKMLDSTEAVVEWIDQNPLAHSDPQYAPVGNYMITGFCCVTRIDA